MRKRIALLTAVVAAGLALSACGGGKNGGNTAGDTAETPAVSEGGQQLDVQVGPSPETIDPALNAASDSGNILIHAFEGLLKFDDKQNIIGGVAESWESSEDGLTWTFHLRPDLKWSDGSELTANDFVYSWKRVADPATAAPYGYDLMNMIVGFDEAAAGEVDKLGVEAPDEGTFVVHLSAPCIYFDKIAAFAVMSPVQQATVEVNGEGWTTDPATYISNGPYRMTEFTDGSQIVLEKNPYYWDAEHITFDRIVWHLIEDANTSYTAYNQGEIDMIKDVPTEEIASLRDNPEFHTQAKMSTSFMVFNTQKAPFDNPKVREALSLAADRKYLAETVLQGISSPAENFVGLGVSDAAPSSSFAEVTIEKYGKHFDVDNYEANLEKAKALLAEAGYPNGEGFPAFSYLTNDAGANMAIAEYLQSAWAELGVTCTINVQEWKTMSADRRNGNFDVARHGWSLDWDDPSNLINLLETGNGNNDGRYSNPEFDKLVQEARDTVDVEKHYDLLHQAEQLILNDAAVMPVVYSNEYWLMKENVKGTWYSPYGYWYFMYGTKE